MARPLRIRGDDLHYHVILRCNNKEGLFRKNSDFQMALDMLFESQQQFGFKLYNYVFLNSHAHLMLSTHNEKFIDKIMHDFCFKFAKQYNRIYKRSGHFWAHRYRSRLITDDRYALACLRYQHRNPVLAGMVIKAEEWRWSGYAYYSFGAADDLLTQHPAFLGLSTDPLRRQQVYTKFVATPLLADKMGHLFEGKSSVTGKRFSMLLQRVNKLVVNIVQY